eukprot:766618-Hanusia_phi.AAC.9
MLPCKLARSQLLAATRRGVVRAVYQVTNCIKTCEDFSFCEDDDSEWYRASTGRRVCSRLRGTDGEQEWLKPAG